MRAAAARVASAAPHVGPVRDAAVDVARGLAMLLVVYGHALEIFFSKGTNFDVSSFEQWRDIYSFHMPLFFLISGMVFRKKDLRTVLTGALSLMAIALMLHVAGWIAIYAGAAPETVTLKTLVKPFLVGEGFHLSVVWFLYSLAFVQVLSFLFWRYGMAARTLIVAVCVGVYAAGYLAEKDYYQVMSWGVGLLFFLIGHAMARLEWRPAFYLFPLFVAAVIFLAPLNHGCLFSFTRQCGLERLHGEYAVWLVYGKIGFLPLFFVTAILGSLAVFSLAQLIVRIRMMSPAFEYFGRHTLDLLIINAFAQGLLNPYMQLNMGSTFREHGTIVAIALTLIQLALLPFLLPLTQRVAQAGRWLALVAVSAGGRWNTRRA